MGWARRALGIDLTGNEAVRQATRQSVAAGNKAAATIQPFRQAGVAALNPLIDLVTNPQAQADYVTNNPMFKALADDATRRLYANQAAKGKLGSGDTPVDLNNQLMPLGIGMAQQHIGNLSNLAGLGLSAAAPIAGIQQGVGNVQSAGTMQRQANTMGLAKDIGSMAMGYFNPMMAAGLQLGQKAPGSEVAVGQMPNRIAQYDYRNPLFMGA